MQVVMKLLGVSLLALGSEQALRQGSNLELNHQAWGHLVCGRHAVASDPRRHRLRYVARVERTYQGDSSWG